MAKRVLVLQGHPTKDSFCGALADAYVEGLREHADAEIRRFNVGEMVFDETLHGGYRSGQSLEADLQAFQDALSWAEHVALVYPMWWGSMPARMKGLLDRTLLPGFAFKYHKDDPFWDRLLAGRTARCLVTMDTPRWFLYLMYGAGGHKAMRHQILKFVGIKPLGIHSIGPVRTSSDGKRRAWLKRALAYGRRDGRPA